MNNKNYINQVFGPDGILSKNVNDYEQRKSQVRMAYAIDTAINKKHHLMVEAPTGTGKSIAYIVPSTYNNFINNKDKDKNENKEKTVIVTANIALQEQLIKKDLPQMADILSWPFTFSLMKGRNNYVCIDKLINKSKPLISTSAPYTKGQYKELRNWAKKTETGDKSELNFVPHNQLWDLFSTTSDDCKRKDCLYYKDCHCTKARNKAHNADVIVCNYHILYAHLLIGGDIVLPKFNIAILDEAHKAADIARDFFEWKISIHGLRSAFKMLGGAEKEKYLDEARSFFTTLLEYKKSSKYKKRIREKHIVETVKIIDLLDTAKEIYKEEIKKLTPSNNIVKEDKKLRINELKKTAEKCELYIRRIQDAMELSDPNSVYYITDNKSTKLCCKLILVNDILNNLFFKKIPTTICTSATLTVNNNFDFICKEIGVEHPSKLIVSTPFNFYKQCSLIIPKDIPDPKDIKYLNTIVENFSNIIKITKGRCLGLFTSYKNLNKTFEKINYNKYTILKQGSAPRTTLIQQFKQNINSILLGTESFWSGVDVPGESLICVIIDKLPFQNLDDPVLDAIMEEQPNAFINYYVPKAVIMFKQGVGRLIRRKNDYGVVVILDPRIITKYYGRYFLSSIPKMMYSDNIYEINEALQINKNNTKGNLCQ